MRDDEIDDDLDELPPDDPTWILERLDAGFDEFAAPDEQSPSGPPLTRQEIEGVVDRVLSEELSRLNGRDPKKKD